MLILLHLMPQIMDEIDHCLKEKIEKVELGGKIMIECAALTTKN